jgi:hypothetical protein
MSAGGEDPARKRETTRRRVAEELLATERSYVESLTTICQVFIVPLQNMLTDEECSTLFSNLQVIAGLNQRLLADMSKRLATWDGMRDGILNAVILLFFVSLLHPPTPH